MFMPNTLFDLLIGIFTLNANIVKHLFSLISPVRSGAEVSVAHIVVTQSRQVTIYHMAT